MLSTQWTPHQIHQGRWADRQPFGQLSRAYPSKRKRTIEKQVLEGPMLEDGSNLATYQIRARARVLTIKAFPRKDRPCWRQELKTFFTTTMRGRQFILSTFPEPKKIPSILSVPEVQSKLTRVSTRPHHEPSHRPLDLT